MAGLRFNSLAGLIAAGSMLFSATAATAQSAPAPQQVSPWAALTILAGGAPAAALCGAAATTAAAQSAAPGCVLPALDAPAPVAQARAAPTPVPPIAAPGGGLGFSPLLLGLVAIAVAAGAYLLTRNGHGNQQQNSPV
jgi:hypothetical protein